MIGLVVNPVAGIGGPAGLAGSDGADVQRSARERGSAPRAGLRALTALEVLAARHPGTVIATASGAMGADAVRAAGLVPWVVYDPSLRSQFVPPRGADSGANCDPNGTDAADTAAAVAALAAAGCELILVVGGDGTMRDVVDGLTPASALQMADDSADGGESAGVSAAGRESVRQVQGPDTGDEGVPGLTPASVLQVADDSADGGGSAGVSAAGCESVRQVQGPDAGDEGVPGLTPASVLQMADDSADGGGSAGVSAAGRESVRQVQGDGRMPAPDAAGQGERMPAVLGIPAGVKMYSPVFAVSPRAAGSVASEWLSRGGLPVTEREVLDIDEEQLRRVRVTPTLFGVLPVPVVPGRTQARKAATPASEQAAVAAAARGVVARFEPGVRYLLGPGGTTAEVARILGIRSTALGVDVIRDGELLRAAASERELLDEIAQGPAKAVVTVIGGQGFLLGRGNQQLSARVIRTLGDDPLLVVAPEQKLIDLGGHPLIVDTGDPDLDARLAGHVRIVTGQSSTAFYPVAAPERLYETDVPPAPVPLDAGPGAEHPHPSEPEPQRRRTRETV
ncbi:hypothetical protein DY023_08995 [Microbacterium bovistercoris]|uniref:ATP-NAD kinase n=1 Tax=Microbacterium bovistercoris TaxID=2293570 RepID=A0A371NTS3_9MICO|nr:NAD(+)/NADH kinase [Microbacterium bovistercoris]REJ05712.1 hypothetical protein DY023_08995 [Microbacterium bovistercoris]